MHFSQLVCFFLPVCSHISKTTCSNFTFFVHVNCGLGSVILRLQCNTHNRLIAFVRDNPGRPVEEETLTHSHPTWSSDILYHLPPFTTIHGVLFVHFTCLTILSDNLCPGPLWSSSWSWTIYFILHTFLHPIIIIFSQHMPIPTSYRLQCNSLYNCNFVDDVMLPLI